MHLHEPVYYLKLSHSLTMSSTGHSEPSSNHYLPRRTACNATSKSAVLWTCAKHVSITNLTFRAFSKEWVLGTDNLASNPWGTDEILPIARRQQCPNIESLCISAFKGHVSEPYNSAELIVLIQTLPLIDNRISRRHHIPHISECKPSLLYMQTHFTRHTTTWWEVTR